MQPRMTDLITFEECDATSMTYFKTGKKEEEKEMRRIDIRRRQ